VKSGFSGGALFGGSALWEEFIWRDEVDGSFEPSK
jgi:hypothetical protein